MKVIAISLYLPDEKTRFEVGFNDVVAIEVIGDDYYSVRFSNNQVVDFNGFPAIITRKVNQ